MSRRKNKKSNEAVISEKQKTNSGISVNAGDITHSDWDSKDWRELQQDYADMLNGCPVISTTWKLIEYPLMNSELKIELGESKSDKSKEIVDYLYYCFENIHKGLKYLKKHKLKAIVTGVAFHEMIEKKADTYSFIQNGVKRNKLTNRIIKLAPIQNDTILQFYYDKTNEFTGIQHEKRWINKDNNSDIDQIDIYTDNLDWFTFNEEFDDVRGQSILRPARYYYYAGQKVMESKVIGTVRGAGIIGIHTHGNVSDADGAKLDKIARSVANLSNGYYRINVEQAELVMQELKGQQDIMGLIQFINRMKFYNTMSQFLTAGIGESGSRAATVEHKAPYELSLNYINSELEANFQELADWMLDISYLSPMIEEDRPKVKFSAITQADMLRESQVYQNFVNAGLVLTEVDWNMIREHLNLPTKQVELEDRQTLPEENVEEKPKEMSHKLYKRNVKPEILEFESNIFELESANEHYLTIQDKTKLILDDIMSKVFSDIKSQLKNNRKKDLDMRYEGELIKRLTKLYEESYNRGERDIKTEMKKLKKNIELSLDPSDKKDLKNNLGKLTKKFYTNVKTTIETQMNKISDKTLDKKGGLDKYLLTMETGFKEDRLLLQSEVESGYSVGRGETLESLQDKIQLYLYSATMDQNVCEFCAPFDGLVLTLEELEAQGLQLSYPYNPDCWGWKRYGVDRCHIIPYAVGD